MLAGGVAAIIYTISVVWALNTIGVLRQAVVAVLVFLGVLAVLATLLNFRDSLPNFFSSFKVRRGVRIGKRIDVAGIIGTVQDVGPLTVKVGTDDGLTVVIPNRTVAKRL